MSTDGLGRAAGRGAMITLAGQTVRLVMQFVSLIVLSRLLTPADFGLVAMVVAVIGVGEVIRDFGLTQAAVQAPRMSTGLRNNLFWINTGLGAGAAIAAAASAPVLAAIYRHQELVAITLALAGTFLVNGMSTQYRAGLNRDMRFLSLAVVESASMAFGTVSAIAAAVIGLGYWALVAQTVVTSVAGLILCVALSRWLPGRTARNVGTKALTTYGSHLLGTQLLTYATRNLDSAIVGFVAGARPLGYYNRAFEVTMAPLNQVQAPSVKVALPVLSRLREDVPRYNRFLLQGQIAMLIPLVALLGVVASQADLLVRLLLGPQWAPAVSIIQVLCIGAFAQAAAYPTYWAFLSKQLTRSNLRFALASRPVVMGLLVCGGFFGLAGVMWAYSLGMIFNWLFGLWWISRADSTLPAKSMASAGLRGLVGFGLPATAGVVTYPLLGASPWASAVALGVQLAALGLILVAWPALRRDVVTSASWFRQILNK